MTKCSSLWWWAASNEKTRNNEDRQESNRNYEKIKDHEQPKRLAKMYKSVTKNLISSFQTIWTKGRPWVVFEEDATFCICKEAAALHVIF